MDRFSPAVLGPMSRRRVIGSFAALPFLAVRPALAGQRFVLTLAARVDTEAPAFSGSAPGPVFRAKQGETIAFELVNERAHPSRLVWRGARSAQARDWSPAGAGETHALVAPAPEAGTFLYEAREETTGGASLSGVLVVEEAAPPAVDRDLVLAVHRGAEGAPFVNGGPAQDLSVRGGERLRLRVANAAAAAPLILAFDALSPTLIALDGRPVDAPYPTGARLDLAPGGRADLIVDVPLVGAISGRIVTTKGEGIADLLRLVPAAAPPARVTPLDPIAALPSTDLPVDIDLATALQADLDLTPHALRPLPLFGVRAGRAVTLAIANPTQGPVGVALYGQAARLLHALDDGWEPCWFDSLLVYPGETIRVAFIPGVPGLWPIAISRPGEAGVVEAAFEVLA